MLDWVEIIQLMINLDGKVVYENVDQNVTGWQESRQEKIRCLCKEEGLWLLKDGL